MSTILVSGASGFVGSALTASLKADGHTVIPLTRSARGRAPESVVTWDAEAGTIDREALLRARPDAVVNLAGEPIDQRWTEDTRRRIRDSRVNGTRALATALAALTPPPRALVNGSAVGYYGANRGDEALDEGAAPGHDFLAETAVAWEAATAPALNAGIRTALFRTGVVLGRGGGALERLLLPFQMGVGGRIGSGRQWLSWIALEDVVRVIRFLIDTTALRGPVNAVSPNPVRNSEFADTLGRVLQRPTILPAPAFALKLVFGEMAEGTIMASQRVLPKRLLGAGFEFRHPRLEDALRAELTRSDGRADR